MVWDLGFGVGGLGVDLGVDLAGWRERFVVTEWDGIR